MVKKFIKYFYSFLIVGALFLILKDCFGIFYLRMSHLSDDELEWVKGPIKYETGIFESSSGISASYSLVWWSIKNATSHLYLNSNIESGGKWEYEALCRYRYIVSLPPSETKLEGFFDAIKSLKTDSLIIKCLFDRRISSSISPNDIQRININGKNFEDCIVIDNSNSIYESNSAVNSSLVERYIISKDYGLIYFKLESGEEFFRKF